MHEGKAPELANTLQTGAAQPEKSAQPKQSLEFTTCLSWLMSIPQEIRMKSPPVRRLEDAAHKLSMPASRQARDALQRILSDWDVKQKRDGIKRPLVEATQELQGKVCQEYRRLKRAHVTGNEKAISFLHPWSLTERQSPSLKPSARQEPTTQ